MIKKKMILSLIILSLLVVVSFTGCIFTRQKSFGRLPGGERLKRVKGSPNYHNGEFQNQNPTPQLSEGIKWTDLPKDMVFKKHKRVKPVSKIPSIKTDLKKLNPNNDLLVWFGHSSYFIQIDGKRVLVDPVFSGHAAPVSFMMKAFKGSDIYKTDDMPEIDYLIITHDHWDHLDYKTIKSLKNHIGKIICSLGVGEHFERWGFDMKKVYELDWSQDTVLDNGFKVYCLPTRHFSGRSTKARRSLWASYLLQTPTMNLFLGGDGGYDTHFAQIGEKFGKIDLAMLENGQYNYKWKYIHTQPEQVVQAAKDLHTKAFIPVHSAKFALASHPWDEPLKRISEVNKDSDLRMLTPMIGEPVYLKDSTQVFKQWWIGLE